jgi:catechol 2,3-dioxygenase-like lactoylglutathione lyase family enzyme
MPIDKATKRIDHIAVVVRDLDAALRVYHDVLGLPLERALGVPQGLPHFIKARTENQ